MDRSRLAPPSSEQRWPTAAPHVRGWRRLGGARRANILGLVRRAPGVNGFSFDEDTPARPNREALEASKQDRLMAVTGRALREAGVPAPR
jgi:hypothetical protein